ncbi:hypothetical protein ABD76_19640, partial [Paenibacillus dendritiformis]|nr:hypothetical protein [Paenibacillus dendritiformis]
MKAYKSSAVQPQMFQFVDMDELVPKKHILRQINEALDLSIVYDWVAPLYTERTGRPAADPVWEKAISNWYVGMPKNEIRDDRGVVTPT